MIRPIFTIVRTITTLLMRSTGLNRTITATLVNNVFFLVSVVYQRYGFIATIQSIATLFSFLRSRPHAITTALLNRRLLNNYPELKTLFSEYISPNWSTMSDHKYRFIFVLFTSIISSSLAIFRPIWFLRFTFGTIISSLGILWNETLSTYEYLRKGAVYVVYLLDNYGFNILISSLRDIKKETDIYLNSSIYIALGVILLGSLGIAISIILLESYIPPITQPVPIGYLDRLNHWLHLDNFNALFRDINIIIYHSFPQMYDYFFSPMKNYFIYPIWKYTISIPTFFCYDWIYHPLADGMRNTYDFIIHLFTSNNGGNNPPNPPTRSVSPVSDGGLSNSSTDTIRPSEMSRSNSNSSEGYFTKGRNTSFVGDGQAPKGSSRVHLEDYPDITNNPFDS